MQLLIRLDTDGVVNLLDSAPLPLADLTTWQCDVETYVVENPEILVAMQNNPDQPLYLNLHAEFTYPRDEFDQLDGTADLIIDDWQPWWLTSQPATLPADARDDPALLRQALEEMARINFNLGCGPGSGPDSRFVFHLIMENRLLRRYLQLEE